MRRAARTNTTLDLQQLNCKDGLGGLAVCSLLETGRGIDTTDRQARLWRRGFSYEFVLDNCALGSGALKGLYAGDEVDRLVLGGHFAEKRAGSGVAAECVEDCSGLVEGGVLLLGWA